MKKIYALAASLFLSAASFGQAVSIFSDTVIINTAGDTGTATMDLTGIPTPSSNAQLVVYTKGDFSATSEYVDVFDEGSVLLGQATSTGDCLSTYDTTIIPITVTDINNWSADNIATFLIDASPAVNICTPIASVYIELMYNAQVADNISVISAGADSLSNCGIYPVNISVTVVNTGQNNIVAGDTLIFSYGSVIENYILPADMLSGDTLVYTFTTAYTPVSGSNSVTVTATYSMDSFAGDNTYSFNFVARPQITQFPYMEDFENGTGGWVEDNTNNGTWAFGTPNNGTIVGANSGGNAWGTGNLTGNYNNNEYSWVESPCFDLSQLCNPVIELAINVHSEYSWDGTVLQASTDGGATWVTIGQFNDPYNWYNNNTIFGLNSVSNGEGWTGSSNPGWMIAKNSLGAVAGQSSVILRVVFGSDGSVNGYDGFAFDDVAIYDGVNLGDVNTVCGQDSLQLSIFSSPTASVVWSTGDTTNSTWVYTTGTYGVTYADTNGCFATDSVIVHFVSLPMTVNLGNDTSICEGSSITLTADMPYSQYSWNTGDTTQSITVSNAGGYMVVVTNECGTAYDNIQVGINPLPVVNLGMDSIVDQGYVLDAGAGFTSYLWNNGATTQTITVLNSGDYSVTVTDANGCSNSDTISLWITGIEELAAQFGAKVYPNPSQGQFTIQLPNNRVELTATITDMTGKAVYTQILANQTTYQINLTGLAKGVYFLNLSDGQKSVTQKLIIK